MIKLPNWILNNRFPSVYDSESKTAIEQTARVYGAMNDLITEYNDFTSKLSEEIGKFEDGITEREECFRKNIIKVFNEYTKSLDNKMANLETFLKLKVDDAINEWVKSGELEPALLNAFNNLEMRVSLIEQNANELVYDSDGESLSLTEV